MRIFKLKFDFAKHTRIAVVNQEIQINLISKVSIEVKFGKENISESDWRCKFCFIFKPRKHFWVQT